MSLTENALYALLDKWGIPYEAAQHEAVMTVAEAAKVVPDQGVATKNLFLRDDKKRQFFLVCALVETKVDLRHLHERLGSRRLSFASETLLRDKLGLKPGSVTPFGVLNDSAHEVTLVFDENLRHARFDAHPLVNTATLFVEMDDVLPLFEEYGTRVLFCDLT
ncbi:MAG: prolyl-tRNA synthetase associated domain-containing protein [Atopobiaceae bacterium]|nr:prolyl-tRNA synthetase associated domain-containing protein [Atopobiaceae bacterium]